VTLYDKCTRALTFENVLQLFSACTRVLTLQNFGQRLLEQFDDKEELKRRFRHTRAPHDRSLLVAAQEGYIQTKEELANALRQTKSS
jgi:hypothetical protein